VTKFKKFNSFLLAIYYTLLPYTVQASAGLDGASRLIDKLQSAALWFGLALGIWGIYEWMMGSPGGLDRFKRAVLGYVAILLMPLLFFELRDSFSIKTFRGNK